MAADPPRLLDKRAGRSYTSDPAMAMFREPEAVDEETQQRISDEARRRFVDDRQQELFTREARSRSVRLRNAQDAGPELDDSLPGRRGEDVEQTAKRDQRARKVEDARPK